jgi:hypothetical protein
MADTTAIYMNTGEELVEIDKGEIYAFRASIRVLNAAFYFLSAYDWDMVDIGSGDDGTYNWISDINSNFAPSGTIYDEPYRYVLDGTVLKLYTWEYWDDSEFSNPYRMELATQTLKYNLLSHASFGKLNQSRMTKVKNNILGAANDLTAGATYIENETDDQTNDVIKLQFITDMNDHINPNDPDNPDFMQSWDDIYDVINWLKGLLNGASFVTTTSDDVTITINFAAFLNGGVSDIRNVIPYMHWNTAASTTGSWLALTSDYNYGWDTTYYAGDIGGEYHVFDGTITRVEFYRDWNNINPGYFTVSDGGAQIADDEIPYFPDYTFGGLFPGMNRTKFLQLVGN